MTLDRTSPIAGQQPKPLVESGGDLRWAHRDHPRGSELDSERDAV
jgi:hypothetical protein